MDARRIETFTFVMGSQRCLVDEYVYTHLPEHVNSGSGRDVIDILTATGHLPIVGLIKYEPKQTTFSSLNMALKYTRLIFYMFDKMNDHEGRVGSQGVHKGGRRSDYLSSCESIAT